MIPELDSKSLTLFKRYMVNDKFVGRHMCKHPQRKTDIQNDGSLSTILQINIEITTHICVNIFNYTHIHVYE